MKAGSSLAVCLVLLVPSAAAHAAQGGGTEFREVDGVVSMEAENFTRNSGYAVMTTNGGIASRDGWSGNGWMLSNASSVRLDYDITFTRTGQYYLHLRTWASDHLNNGYHAELDGKRIKYTDGIYVRKYSRWSWHTSNQGVDDNHQTAVTLDVTSAGKHTFSILLREDVVSLDKIVIHDGTYGTAPDSSISGTGPAETPAGGGGGNTVPSAQDRSVSVTRDTSVAISLAYADPDGPGPYSFSIVAPPAHGSLSGAGQQRTYTPALGYVGVDGFSWRVNDGVADSNTAVVNITVTAPGGGGGSLGISNSVPSTYVWDTLGTGKLQYIDRNYDFTGVPASRAGLDYLRTANDDKGSTGNVFITFDVAVDVTVLVAHDDRFTATPSWMSGFADTGEDLVSGGGTFSLWARDYAAGTVTLGGNTDIGGSANSMYTVVVAPASGGSAGDSDGDGLPDSWEQSFFGNLNETGAGDPDGDGISNLQEYSQGTDPTRAASPGSGGSGAGGNGKGKGGACGATGLEVLILFAGIGIMRRLVPRASGRLQEATRRHPAGGLS